VSCRYASLHPAVAKFPAPMWGGGGGVGPAHRIARRHHGPRTRRRYKIIPIIRGTNCIIIMRAHKRIRVYTIRYVICDLWSARRTYISSNRMHCCADCEIAKLQEYFSRCLFIDGVVYYKTHNNNNSNNIVFTVSTLTHIYII